MNGGFATNTMSTTWSCKEIWQWLCVSAYRSRDDTYAQRLDRLRSGRYTLRVGANFVGASKPRDMIRSFTHKPPYIFLKTATIPTYYGISIAIPRYIDMQISTIPFIMTHSSLSYCLAWSCSWHSICGKATVHSSFIHVTLGPLHIPVHRRRHSYRVIFCSSIEL